MMMMKGKVGDRSTDFKKAGNPGDAKASRTDTQAPLTKQRRNGEMDMKRATAGNEMAPLPKEEPASEPAAVPQSTAPCGATVDGNVGDRSEQLKNACSPDGARKARVEVQASVRQQKK